MAKHSASPLDSDPDTQKRQLLSILESYPLHDRVLWEPLQNAIDCFYDENGNPITRTDGSADPIVTVKFNTDDLSSDNDTISVIDNGPGMKPVDFGYFVKLGLSKKYQTMEDLSENYGRIRRIIKGSQGVGVKGTVFSSDIFRIKSVYIDDDGDFSEWNLELEDMSRWEAMDIDEYTIMYDDDSGEFTRKSDDAVLGKNKKSEDETTGVSLTYKISQKIPIPDVSTPSGDDGFSVSRYLDSIVDEYLQSIGNPVWDDETIPLGEDPEKPVIELEEGQDLNYDEGHNKWFFEPPSQEPILPPNSGAFVHRGQGNIPLPRISISEMIVRWFKLSKYSGDLTRIIEIARKEESILFQEHQAAKIAVGKAIAVFDYNEQNKIDNPATKEALEREKAEIEELQTTLGALKNDIIDLTDSPKLVIDLSAADSSKSKHFGTQNASEVEEE